MKTMANDKKDAASYFKKAKKLKRSCKIGVSGPSGSGKTYSSLLIASGLVGGDWSKIAVIDTEDSASLYSNLGDFSVLNINKPYDPKKFKKAIELANEANFEVILLDSSSHEWQGCLDLHANLGGRFTDWSVVTPLHEEFIQSIKDSKAHVISCVRKKTDYSMTSEGGRTKVEKVGLKEVQRDNYEYEFDIFFDINIHHLAQTSKDRTGLFMDRTPFIITKATGDELSAWANKGE